MEKRQAVILLVLVLVVSLASFTLGVIVGRRGAERDLTQKFQQTERVLVAQAPAPVVAPPATSEMTKTIVSPAPEVVQEETKLSFYDDLAKETVPLGSGINLAPIEEKPTDVAVHPPIDLPDQPIIKKEAPDVAAVTPPKTESVASTALTDKVEPGLPKAVAKGSHAVQIGSFGAAGDAITLKQKMVEKGYPAFVVEADLGKKGLWYRVRIGPYQDSVAATSAQKILEEKEKIKGFITRQ
ncbi:SPOR domain-containing protein [uncultured Desulfuromusa sp.]|nr:SPOR domain-containing protein [uncultured Desulfuromusa sp.]